MLLIKCPKNPIRGLFIASLAISGVILLTTVTSYVHYALTLPAILYVPVILSVLLLGFSKTDKESHTHYKYVGISLLKREISPRSTSFVSGK